MDQSQKTREKFTIIIILTIVTSTFLITTVFTDLYYFFTMNGSYAIDNVYRPNWSYPIFADFFSLSGLTLAAGTVMFVVIVFYGSTYSLFPGVVFFAAAWLSIPFMFKFTKGMPSWKRILYIYLTSALLSAPILAYWTGFGA